jgi:hypothetical protein
LKYNGGGFCIFTLRVDMACPTGSACQPAQGVGAALLPRVHQGLGRSHAPVGHGGAPASAFCVVFFLAKEKLVLLQEIALPERQADLLQGLCDTLDSALASVSYDGVAAVPDLNGVRLDYLRALV